MPTSAAFDVRITCAVGALAAVVLTATPAHAQRDVAVTPLDSADRVIGQPFSLLRGIRELADGRVIVSDFIEDRIAIVDFAANTVTDRNRSGPGPQEFRLPGSLLRFTGDSTLLLDAGNSRIDVLDSDGRIARSFRPSVSSAITPRAVDARGRLYHSIPPWNASTPLRADTVELAIWDAATDSGRPFSRVHGSTTPPPPKDPRQGPRIPFVVFAKQDGWAVAPNGRVAVVRGEDYSVRWIDGGRVVATGPSYAWRTRKVTEADREAETRRFMAGSAISGRGPDGGLGHLQASQLSNEAIANSMRFSTFAETMPFFTAGDVHIDANGRLWVGRTGERDDARRYDIFDGEGRMIGAVRLARDRRLLGFGARHAYVAHTNAEDGLETLERLPMRALRN